jgi:hypothetical protein
MTGSDASEKIPVATKITRSERVLERLVSQDLLSPHGRDFLIASVDPFHDTQLRDYAGFPDLDTTPSVRRLIKQSVTISCPTTITGNWDLHIVQWPWLVAASYVGTNRTNNYISIGVIPTLATIKAIGGLSAYATVAGVAPNFNSIPTSQLTLADAFTTGSNRVIGMGFEVVNTTSDLYRQGQVAVWRQPNSAPDTMLFHRNSSTQASGTAVVSEITGVIVPCPPHTIASAMLQPGTRQWKAADGAYVVSPHISADNPAKFPDYTQPIVNLDEGATDTLTNKVSGVWPVGNNNLTCLCPIPVQPTVAAGTYDQAFRCYPIHMTGALFTGLSNESTLTINWNVYLETFPTVAEPDIVVLATPSAGLDPVALKLYSECMMSLPVGVPVDENPLGEWFAQVVDVISDFLTPAAMAFGLPGLSLASKGAGMMARSHLDKLKREREEARHFETPPSSMGRPVPLARRKVNKTQVKALERAPVKGPKAKALANRRK